MDTARGQGVGWCGAGRDPYVAPIPWRKLLFTGELGPSTRKKLTIGVYNDDLFFPSTPAIRRAVLLAKNALESLGSIALLFCQAVNAVNSVRLKGTR